MVYNLSVQNSLLSHWLSEIRDVGVQADRMRFRRNTERFGEIAAYEISKQLPYHSKTVPTSLGESVCQVLSAQPVIGTILRAGIQLQQGLLNYFDHADCAFAAAYRKYRGDGTFDIKLDYTTCPSLSGRIFILADPMLATGASVVLALESLLQYGKPAQIHIVSMLACTIGVEYVLRRFPEVTIWTGDIDDELTGRGFIVPGLGDAGDLLYGDKEQE